MADTSNNSPTKILVVDDEPTMEKIRLKCLSDKLAIADINLVLLVVALKH
ncbi:MAG: hypothetical protein HC847_20335 [Hydrococcus sp. RU_2_2]|nr:hypothetical protein [Hydrococcus sp. RU_2_2]